MAASLPCRARGCEPTCNRCAEETKISADLRLLTARRTDLACDRVCAINRLRATMLEYFQRGTAKAEVRCGSSDSMAPRVQWDAGAFEYVPAAGWDDHGPLAAVQSRDERDQGDLEGQRDLRPAPPRFTSRAGGCGSPPRNSGMGFVCNATVPEAPEC